MELPARSNLERSSGSNEASCPEVHCGPSISVRAGRRHEYWGHPDGSRYEIFSGSERYVLSTPGRSEMEFLVEDERFPDMMAAAKAVPAAVANIPPPVLRSLPPTRS